MLDPKDGLDSIGEPDVVFPALHGVGGEDGTIQQELEKRGLAYVGSDSAASALCFDKWAYKDKLRDAGLPVAEGAMVDAQTFWDSPLIQKPYVLKPVDGGSTIDTFIIRDPAAADTQKIQDALNRYDEMLLEELVEGVEITVGVLGDTALPPVEIIPPEGGEFDYENKYNGKTRELCPAENVDTAGQETAKELALKAHQLTGCKDISRTDIIVRADGSQAILETNTLPGMTDQSLYPKAAAAAGIGFAELVDRLARMAKA
jgi:D-alanine--D-alanine ligase